MEGLGITNGVGRLPCRSGPGPRTLRRDGRPHAQLSQNAPIPLQEGLFARASSLPGVAVGPSLVSVPGARALLLEGETGGPPEAFQAGREFAHVHPSHDGSLHVTLPPALAGEVEERGWGEGHPVSDTIMVYGPRDEGELEVVWRILLASYRFAAGDGGETIRVLLRRRRSGFAFSERRVEPEEVRGVLEAARWAPSSYNEQPWSFLVATADESEEYERMAGCLAEGNRRWACRAPVLLLSVARTRFSKNGRENRHALHDVGLATGNLILQATALGLSAHAMGGFDRGRARELYGIPEDHEPVAVIALGYPGDTESLPGDLRERETAPRARRPLAEFVYAGRFGRSALAGRTNDGRPKP